jgi:hypothetical protein
MKAAICSKCGKPTGGYVPEGATDIVCFACNEAEERARVREEKRKGV